MCYDVHSDLTDVEHFGGFLFYLFIYKTDELLVATALCISLIM